MRHDRIYKSLTLEDFIAQSSFIFAHGGMYLGGVISDFNYIRTLPRMTEMSDAELKTEFMQNVIKALESCQGVNIKVNDYGKYYDVWYDWCDTPEDSGIGENNKEHQQGDLLVIGKITSDEKEKMTLEDFLVWSLSGAKQAYECNLPENSPSWDSLSDEDKIGLVAHEITVNADDFGFEYRLLARCKADCLYFLGYGKRKEKYLWGKKVKDHIQKMRDLLQTVPEEPVWLTKEDVKDFERKMLAENEGDS